VRQYLSFASKFCSWHNPTAYPIYDGNVRECLSSYQKQDSFAQFRNKEDLYYYQKLFDAVLAFSSHYGLNSLTFKQLDKFMYRVGGQILKARKGQKGQAPAI
jgi:vacuolar-type H+-ATPase subunit C/Vma6